MRILGFILLILMTGAWLSFCIFAFWQIIQEEVLKKYNKIYNKSYKIDFKNKQIFELMDFDNKELIELKEDDVLLSRSLDYFKVRFYDKNITLQEIEKRIFYGSHDKDETNSIKKNFLISPSNDIHYIVDNHFLSRFFILKETCYNDNDYSITNVYLDAEKKIYYHIKTYPMNEYSYKKRFMELQTPLKSKIINYLNNFFNKYIR